MHVMYGDGLESLSCLAFVLLASSDLFGENGDFSSEYSWHVYRSALLQEVDAINSEYSGRPFCLETLLAQRLQ